MKTFFSKTSFGVWVIASIVIYFSLNIIGNLSLNQWRIDLTQERLHTISSSTKKVLSTIDEPIDIKVYFSQKLGEVSPPYKDFYLRLKSFLQSYKRLSGDNIRVQFFTPEPYSQTEDDALLNGLKSATISEFDDQVYFGLVATNSIDKKEVIPFFDLNRESFLEYDLSLLIHKLSQKEAIKVGVLSGWSAFGNTLMLQQIQSSIETEIVAEDAKEIPQGISSLIVVRPETLSDVTLLAVEQFALKGGNIMLFVDPLLEQDKMTTANNAQRVSQMLKAWGVEYDSSYLVSDLHRAISVSSHTPQGVKNFKHPTWIQLDESSLADDNIITSKLEKLMIASSGFLQPLKDLDNENRFVPLITVGDKSAKVSADKFKYISLELIKKSQKEGNETFYIGAHILAKGAKSIFEKGLFDEENNQTIKPKILEAKESVNALIFADVDLLTDNMWARVNNFFGQSIIVPSADNGRLVSNAVENLNGNDAFIDLRGRGKITRGLLLIENIEKSAQREFLQKENNLREKLNRLQTQIDQQRESIKDSTLLNNEQQKLIDEAQNEMVKVRQELRAVQHELRKDIESVKNIFKWINILGMPLLIIGVGYLFNRYRKKRQMGYFQEVK